MTTGKVIFDQGRKVIEEADKRIVNFGAKPKPRFRWTMSLNLQVESDVQPHYLEMF